MARALRRVCVFCGSKAGVDPSFRRVATELGERLAAERVGLVFGGGSVGLMGVIADAVLAGGGEAIGVITERLAAPEIAHRSLTDLRVVRTMHERKALMSELSDAFLALPGGIGTFEELFEVLTWAQLGIHAKPIGLVNVSGYYDPLIALLEHAVEQGFFRGTHRDLMLVVPGSEEALPALRAHRLPKIEPLVSPTES
ncbi:MAG: TIGR00730 family Rossman fold protein [Fimbriimonadaceae bacterium]|nr:TIGR00730 family Rossman fold protein [Fimbriimonadaceae bacterium]